MNIKNKAQSHYQRKVITKAEFTHLFNECSEEVHNFFNEYIDSDNFEKSILYGFFSKDEWFVISTEMIFIKSTNDFQAIELKEVNDFKLDLNKIKEDKNIPINEIKIELSNKKSVYLKLEKDTYGAILSMLMFLHNHYKSK